MKQLFNDIIGFMKGLTQIDILLYLSILVLIILVVSLIYIIKNSEEENIDFEENTDLNLNKIVDDISSNREPVIEFTNYEKDQEEKAIISYDELIAKNKTGPINYNDEQILEDNISIKKIDLEHITKEIDDKEKKADNLFRYSSEEAFLKTLKSLDEILN